MLVAMDLFIVNLAYSAISEDFTGAAPQTMSWIINAYAVTFAALLVPAGRMADRFGRRKLFRLGLTVFVTGSLGAAMSSEIFLLIAARGVQGAGAALFVPTGMALLLASSPPSRHTRMIAIWMAIGAVSAALGPIVGGALTGFHWRWIFVLSLPVVVIGLLTSSALTETPRDNTRIPDLWGSLLLAAGVGTLITALSYASDWGLTDPRLSLLLAISAVMLAVFVRRSLTVSAPAVNLTLFRDHTFAWAAIGSVTFYVGFSILLLGGSLMLTRVWEMDPFLAGLAFSLGPLAAMVSSILAGRSSLSHRVLSAMGSIIMATAGVIWLVFLTTDSGLSLMFFAGLIVSGLGAGTGQIGFTAAGASSVPSADYGAGIGLINTARQLGTALGVATLVMVIGASALAEDFRAAWLTLIAFALVSAGTTLFFRPAHQPAN